MLVSQKLSTHALSLYTANTHDISATVPPHGGSQANCIEKPGSQTHHRHMQKEMEEGVEATARSPPPNQHTNA